MFHLLLHFLVPAIVTGIFFRKNWKFAFILLISTTLVDLDHLVANPIYNPNRCSIGFHPLHQVWLIPFYIAMCFFPKTKLVGLGLTIHMALDSIDCQFTNGVWCT